MSNNVRRRKNLVIERLNRRLLGESEMDCPKASQDLELNTKNRDSSIKSEHIKYGPVGCTILNVTQLELVIRGQKVVQLIRIKFLMSGKKEIHNSLTIL